MIIKIYDLIILNNTISHLSEAAIVDQMKKGKLMHPFTTVPSEEGKLHNLASF